MCNCNPEIRATYCIKCVPKVTPPTPHVPSDNVTARNEACADPVVEANVAMLRNRSRVGIGKYGMTLADNPLTLREWLQHALEESLDHVNYLQRAIQEIDNVNRTQTRS